MYRWDEHTSEVELAIEADSATAVFEQATLALAELLEDATAKAPLERRVRVSAEDLPTLLAEWLAELVYLSETEGFLAERATELSLSGATIEATVSGRRTAPQTLVKGVTYHRLALEPAAGRWRARVVLDV